MLKNMQYYIGGKYVQLTDGIYQEKIGKMPPTLQLMNQPRVFADLNADGQEDALVISEFFTPTSIVKLIVEIIEPYHGLLLDAASGSGGMFVQSARFVTAHRKNPVDETTNVAMLAWLHSNACAPHALTRPGSGPKTRRPASGRFC
jgi:hypothetical protein